MQCGQKNYYPVARTCGLRVRVTIKVLACDPVTGQRYPAAGKVTVGLASHHRIEWFIRLRAQCLSRGDEHPTYTPHRVWPTLYLFSTARWRVQSIAISDSVCLFVDCPSAYLKNRTSNFRCLFPVAAVTRSFLEYNILSTAGFARDRIWCERRLTRSDAVHAA